MSELRYVILRHDDIPDPHFDLMFERSPTGPLATWRSFDWPLQDGTPLQRLPDHRRKYLTYEGLVSNNRGSVRRVAQGTFELLCEAKRAWHVRLDQSQEWLLEDDLAHQIQSK